MITTKLGVAALTAAIWMASATAAPSGIVIRDITPKFLSFYRLALSEQASPDRRFQLWKQEYGFAAVPPTKEGEAMARKMLDDAWARYPSAIERIEKGAAGVEPSPQGVLEQVDARLRPDRPTHMTLLVYVGAFEGNAFTTASQDGLPAVAIPAEQSPRDRGPLMAHEFTHAVRIGMGKSSGKWERSIGETVLSEGLAMRVAQSIFPDRPDTAFIEMPDDIGWLAHCTTKRTQILQDVAAVLDSGASGDVMRFTMGTGPSGLRREAYYAGWLVVDYLLRHGMDFAAIARIPESEAPAAVRRAITGLLAET